MPMAEEIEGMMPSLASKPTKLTCLSHKYSINARTIQPASYQTQTHPSRSRYHLATTESKRIIKLKSHKTIISNSNKVYKEENFQGSFLISQRKNCKSIKWWQYRGSKGLNPTTIFTTNPST